MCVRMEVFKKRKRERGNRDKILKMEKREIGNLERKRKRRRQSLRGTILLKLLQ